MEYRLIRPSLLSGEGVSGIPVQFFDFLETFWYLYSMKPVLCTITVEGTPA